MTGALLEYGRLPAAPLVAAVEATGRPVTQLTDVPAARKAYYRGRQQGWFTPDAADTLATKLLGVHPSELFPQWLDIVWCEDCCLPAPQHAVGCKVYRRQWMARRRKERPDVRAAGLKQTSAYRAALRRLREAHRGEFARLYVEELKRVR